MNNESVIEKEDMQVIESIANKYNISVTELGRILSRKNNECAKRFQILLTVDELHEVDKKAKSLDLSRTRYCSMCFKKGIDEELYKNINMVELTRRRNASKGEDIRSQKTPMYFADKDYYLLGKKIAKEMGVSFGSFVRWFALNVELV